MRHISYKKYLFIGLLIGIASALLLPRHQEESLTPRDMDKIKAEGILRVVADGDEHTSSESKDVEPEDIHLRFIRLFAEAYGLSLEIIPESNIARQNQLLKRGKCDVIASSRLTSNEPDSLFSYTIPVMTDRLMLIQRKKEYAKDSLSPYIHSQLELAGKVVCIPEESPAKLRIRHFMEEIGDTIYIDERPEYSTEQLMSLVSTGERDYAICNEKRVQALLNRYPQLDATLPFSFNQFYCWAVNPESAALLDSLNTWLETHRDLK